MYQIPHRSIQNPNRFGTPNRNHNPNQTSQPPTKTESQILNSMGICNTSTQGYYSPTAPLVNFPKNPHWPNLMSLALYPHGKATRFLQSPLTNQNRSGKRKAEIKTEKLVMCQPGFRRSPARSTRLSPSLNRLFFLKLQCSFFPFSWNGRAADPAVYWRMVFYRDFKAKYITGDVKAT